MKTKKGRKMNHNSIPLICLFLLIFLSGCSFLTNSESEEINIKEIKAPLLPVQEEQNNTATDSLKEENKVNDSVSEIHEQESGSQLECTSNEDCSYDECCSDNVCVEIILACGYVENHTAISHECCSDSECPQNKECIENQCIVKQGCAYNNPPCDDSYDCIINKCILEEGCKYENPPCEESYNCIENECILKEGCQYSNPPCLETQICINNICVCGSGCEDSDNTIFPEGPLPPESCVNNIKDNGETDVDCGGSCPVKCAAGKICQENSDCASSNCTSGICVKTQGGPGAYSDYNFYTIDTTNELEIYLTWIERPRENVGIYAAFTFGFETGRGGYMGLQRDGSLSKDRILFSIWSADDQSQTAECVSTGFDSTDLLRCGKLTADQSGEGSFGQALGMYEWKEGREYKLKIESAGTDSEGEFWKATVTDMKTNVTTEIGTIHLDNIGNYTGYGKLKASAAVFLEYYYGHSGYCDENNVFSKVQWRGPYIDGVLADKGYTWYPISCFYTRQYSPEKGVIIHEGGGKTAWENKETIFWE